jgi:hypothetical protein
MPELTLNEWRAEGRRLHRQEGLNALQIRKIIGDKEGFDIENSNSLGIRFRPKGVKAKRLKLEKVPDSNRSLFVDDESFNKYKKSVAQDKRGINERTTQASKDRGIKYNKGHLQSAETGGPTSSRNLTLENGSRNSSHGAASASRGALLNTGVSTSWKEDAINYLDSSGLPLEYPPKALQEIRRASPDMVDEVTAKVDKEVWDRIKKNPNARPIRTNPNPQIFNPPTKQNFAGLTIDQTRPGLPKPRKVKTPKIPKALKIPLLGGLVAGATTLASGGDAMAALGDAIDAENPFDSGPVADGTVSGYQQERNNNPLHYGKHGPNAPRPGQRERSQQLRINPSAEMGIETISRYVKDGWNQMKSLFIK